VRRSFWNQQEKRRRSVVVGTETKEFGAYTFRRLAESLLHDSDLEQTFCDDDDDDDDNDDQKDRRIRRTGKEIPWKNLYLRPWQVKGNLGWFE